MITHGTLSSYTHGCRCNKCKRANANHFRAKRRALQRLADRHKDEFERYFKQEKKKVIKEEKGVVR